MQNNNHTDIKNLDRDTLITHILSDLYKLRSENFPNQYAIEENIAFFKAIRSIPRYLWWLTSRAPKLDREKLLELTDFPFPRWDREMHRKLIEVESRDFPGLVKPLVGRLMELIDEKKRGPFVAINLGCGGMEVERQIIKKLIDSQYEQRVILIGIDKSRAAEEIAIQNLREVEQLVDIHHFDHFDYTKLNEILCKENNRHTIILAKNDIFELTSKFPPNSIDVVYHTFLKHHLAEDQKTKLNALTSTFAVRGLEYDGYKFWPLIIGPHTWTAWRHPAFLCGTIFSDMRYYTKKELNNFQVNGKLKFYKIATYLLEYEVATGESNHS